MPALKPVKIVESLVEHLNDNDCYEIIELLLSGTIIQKDSTIYKVEKLVKRVADLERATI